MLSYIHRALSSREKTRGFSLVETVVVVAILGVLVLVAIPVFGAIQANARGETLTAAANNVASSLSAALVEKPNVNTAKVIVDGYNAKDNVKIRYTLAQTNHIAARAPGDTLPLQYVSVGTSSQRATNASSEDVFVYAVDDAKNWVGVGTAGATVKISSWK